MPAHGPIYSYTHVFIAIGSVVKNLAGYCLSLLPCLTSCLPACLTSLRHLSRRTSLIVDTHHPGVVPCSPCLDKLAPPYDISILTVRIGRQPNQSNGYWIITIVPAVQPSG